MSQRHTSPESASERAEQAMPAAPEAPEARGGRGGPGEVPAAAIHGLAPEFLSMTALFTAPIDIEAAVARLDMLWQLPVEGGWDEVTAEQSGGASGSLYHFETPGGVTVMLTPVSGTLELEQGQLPEHDFHVMVSAFAPIVDPRTGERMIMGELDAADLARDSAGNDGGDAGTRYVVDPKLPEEIQRRRRAIDAHTALAQVMDALMREDAAIGVYRWELGTVQPPRMIVELADMLGRGQVPLPLWIGIRTYRPQLTNARTLGLRLFGHLDLEVMDCLHGEEEVYSMLANLADYLVTSDQFLMPGSTIGYRGDELTITQATSPADNEPVLRIGY